MHPLAAAINKDFEKCTTQEALYHKIIEWGKKLPSMAPEHKTEDNRVKGCQSIMYLHTELKEGKLYFTADSDALISKGLAALLIHFYQGQTIETLFTQSPTFLEELGILGALTPGRASGAASLYNTMRKQAATLPGR